MAPTATAKVLGTDPDANLAVVQVDVPASLLIPVQLGDSNEVNVGQMAVAIGNPFGLEKTMTYGIISAVAVPSAVAPASSPSLKSSRPMRRSTPGTPAARCWIVRVR